MRRRRDGDGSLEVDGEERESREAEAAKERWKGRVKLCEAM